MKKPEAITTLTRARRSCVMKTAVFNSNCYQPNLLPYLSPHLPIQLKWKFTLRFHSKPVVAKIHARVVLQLSNMWQKSDVSVELLKGSVAFYFLLQ